LIGSMYHVPAGTGVAASSFFAWLTDAGTPNGVSGAGFGNCSRM
jgi:hypothetical protein